MIMIITVDKGKTFDKNPTTFHVKNKKREIKVNILNLIEVTSEKPTSNNI